mmetsp:Transcript_41767/g.163877  ORF Transcript_41767/g.163877 Transcript_41767/m.163877 type:complete len:186 (-) Transcript_41767:628-1185(-)
MPTRPSWRNSRMFLTLFNTKELKRRRASERNGETSESDEKETERSISRACRVFDQHHQSHFIWSSRVAHLVDSKISQILSRPVIDLGQLQMYAGQERAGNEEVLRNQPSRAQDPDPALRKLAAVQDRERCTNSEGEMVRKHLTRRVAHVSSTKSNISFPIDPDPTWRFLDHAICAESESLGAARP